MSHDAIYLALLYTCGLTLLVTIIEVVSQAKSNVRSAISSKFGIYLIIQLVGNLFATILAAFVVADKFPVTLLFWSPFLVAIAGVFAFEVILSNTNINVFDKKVLTIQEWIYKAKDPAISQAIEKYVLFKENENMRLATRLSETCDLQTINTNLNRLLAPDERQQMKSDIQECSADELQYKCLEFVSRFPNQAAALLSAKRI